MANPISDATNGKTIKAAVLISAGMVIYYMFLKSFADKVIA